MFKVFLTYLVEDLATSNMILSNTATAVSRSLNFWFSKSLNFLQNIRVIYILGTKINGQNEFCHRYGVLVANKCIFNGMCVQ